MKQLIFLAALCVTLSGCQTDNPKPYSAHVNRPTPKILITKAYGVGVPLPKQSARPPELVVDVIPAPVFYHFCDDATIVLYAETLRHTLEEKGHGAFGNVLLVSPGAWNLMRPLVGMPRGVIVEVLIVRSIKGLNSSILEGRLTDDVPGIDRIAVALRAMLREDGGYGIRGLRAEEMAKWWVYRTSDIMEPSYVVETKGGYYKFVIGFGSDGKISSIDELNALPDIANGFIVPTKENMQKLTNCSE